MASGQVKLEWKHLAFLGDESRWAAEAAECAGEQNRFWQYHDRLFDVSQGRGSARFEQAHLKQYASELGLDTQAFNTCVDSGRYAARVRAESDEARWLGVNRTPTLEINGQRLVGVPAIEEVRAFIQAAAQSARRP